MNSNNDLIGFSIFLLIVGIVIFVLPIPYTATEVYTEQEPYVDQEYYTEQQPITVEECKTDISLNPAEYLERGLKNIDSILEGDLDKLIETCKDVIKYRTITKSRDVVKYKTVTKERPVTKKATLFTRWTGQIQYRYEV